MPLLGGMMSRHRPEFRTIRARLVLIVIATTILGLPSARAHTCLLPVGAPANSEFLLTVGVTSEQQPLTAIDLDVPPGLFLTPLASEGWSVQREQGVIHYTGGRLEPLACTYFTLRVAPTVAHGYLLPLHLHGADGSLTTLDQKLRGPKGGQVVLVDTSLEEFLGTAPSRNSLPVPWLVGGLAAVVLLGGYALRRRRSRHGV